MLFRTPDDRLDVLRNRAQRSNAVGESQTAVRLHSGAQQTLQIAANDQGLGLESTFPMRASKL